MSSLDDARAALAAFDEEGRTILLRRLAGKRKSAPMNRLLPNGATHVRAALAEVDRLESMRDRLESRLAARAPDLREISALRAALCATLSEAPCRLDHDGRCQEHGPGPIPCPVPAAWALAVGAPLPPEPEPSALALFLAVFVTDEDPGSDLGGGDCNG